jgi:hypothetical protein
VEKRPERGLVVRKDGRIRRQMTIYLPPKTVGRLKLHMVLTDQEISDFASRAIEALLEQEHAADPESAAQGQSRVTES